MTTILCTAYNKYLLLISLSVQVRIEISGVFAHRAIYFTACIIKLYGVPELMCSDSEGILTALICYRHPV